MQNLAPLITGVAGVHDVWGLAAFLSRSGLSGAGHEAGCAVGDGTVWVEAPKNNFGGGLSVCGCLSMPPS
jgi:hypothetical protein